MAAYSKCRTIIQKVHEYLDVLLIFFFYNDELVLYFMYNSESIWIPIEHLLKRRFVTMWYI